MLRSNEFSLQFFNGRGLRVVSACALICMFYVFGCASRNAAPQSSANTSVSESSDLTREQAQSRKERLSAVVYDLQIDLSNGDKPEQKTFAGDLDLRFRLKSGKQNDLQMDFFEGEVRHILVNGHAIPLTAKKRYGIDLPAAFLQEGQNQVQIAFTQNYSTSGQGLHRFIDPEDKRVYLYSQFETFDANRFMPSFDQPDLRSVLKLKVIAPKAWTVISGEIATSVKTTSKSLQTWSFAPTQELATYLFSLHAGEYEVFKDKFVRGDKSTVDLRLFIRRSLKPFLVKYQQQKDWFLFTKEALSFYEKYFATPYPFSKLDQIIAPEFNHGGMENAGAIVYTEWNVSRSKLTRKMRRNLASLQLHEIAHMWFGDLVTMAWWNDLWLNESFATFMAAQAMSEGTEFKESWQTFAGGTKLWAYHEDAMITTHPIEAPVNTVKEAESIFDSITYNKGASVIKQLSFYITPESFREGIRTYFQRHSFQNTTLVQFISALQAHTRKDLSLWADRWLRQSGTDRIAAEWRCTGDRLKTMNLTLTPTDGKEFRPQSFEVGLFKSAGKKAGLTEKIRVDFETTGLKTLIGDWACPHFVYPNNADHGYVQVRLDDVSLQFLKNQLATIDSLLVRSLVWNDLWRMVRDTELSLKDYVAIVKANFPIETDEVITQQVANTIYNSENSILYYWSKTGPSHQSSRLEFLKAMESNFFQRIRSAKSGSDEQKFWFDNFVHMVETQESLSQLYSWYKAGRVSANFALDDDRKWSIARALSRYQQPKADDVFAQMKAKDKSDRGLKKALSVDAVKPDMELKRKWVAEMVDAKNTRPLNELQSVTWSIFPTEQASIKMSFSDTFYDYLSKNYRTEDVLKVNSVVESLMPLNCSAIASAKLKRQIEKYSDANPLLKKNLMMSVDEDERCQSILANSSL